MLRYDRQVKPGLVTLYDIRPGNAAVYCYNSGARRCRYHVCKRKTRPLPLKSNLRCLLTQGGRPQLESRSPSCHTSPPYRGPNLGMLAGSCGLTEALVHLSATNARCHFLPSGDSRGRLVCRETRPVSAEVEVWYLRAGCQWCFMTARPTQCFGPKLSPRREGLYKPYLSNRLAVLLG